MKKEIVLSNGKFFINIDKDLAIRDFYFPYVGMYNHLNSQANSIGVWTGGKFRWIDDSWQKSFDYYENSLVAKLQAISEELQIKLDFTTAIHKYSDILIHKVKVTNLSMEKQDFKVFFYHCFRLNESEIGNTAYYDPKLKGLIHYKGATYIYISSEGLEYEYTVSKKNHETGAWKEIESGKLLKTKIMQGEIDSAWGVKGELLPLESKEFFYYILVGKRYEDIVNLKRKVEREGLQHLLEETDEYWKGWIKTKDRLLPSLSKDLKNQYYRSLLIIRSHFDNEGAVVAANDTSIYKFNKDHYSYLWPRDGAFICMTLDNAGYTNLTQKFYKFCKKHITEEGYLLHKYSPDGTAGSSWHPWCDEDENYQLPIQEDETALVIFALYNHYINSKDIEFIDMMYNGFVRKAANFMVNYTDPNTNLPLESYDLWEERRGVFTYTASTVYAGLLSASKLAYLVGNKEEGLIYEEKAEKIREGILKYLYDEESGRFLRGIYQDKNGNIIKDKTLESSLLLIHEFGVVDPEDYRMINTVKAIEEGLWIKEGIGGLARYENDYYHRVSDNVPGNPWIITTLWLANWYTEVGLFDKTFSLLNWVLKRKTQAGLLAEQYNPFTGEPLSVCPLTWSHSSFCYSVQKLNKKLIQQKIPEYVE
ncbi:glucan 1,4 alpha-glucosidase [Sulfurihydrogenibium azorense Az-Fu1]|uniref:Glucan 1,4 alpha-glucosidase n=1 Tax=Sulfurihydrogenibium azorense (strain DSM 15241 / OCM 825 / Az-Fu1) TaxID=204536 RepID=C1DTU7_SULAA|nr:glycoside hydrolase family 15 protein [Sulfurihydrogenibium azorense]ACN99512.1 glucan 1,4 alpha-glucosidase [Sulfurihydrogenibium azorense Az-Fu1]